MNEPGIGLGAGVENGDSTEGRFIANGIDNGPYCGPHFLVGI